MMRRWAALGLAMAVAPLTAEAVEGRDLSVAAGRLDAAILQLGRQAGVSIALADPSLGHIRVDGVAGRLDAETALRRLLRGTGLTIVAIESRSFRIVRAPAPPPRPPKAHPAPPPSRPQPTPEAPKEIVVTASKRDTLLDDYPASAAVMALDSRFGAGPGQHGTAAIVGQLPALNSTNLGPGRNKLFIRGVADSSFTGPTQATVGQYFGYARLNYNAPDPDLDLYDIDKVEVLEGPQGTLYGAGSLGGIVRLSPNMPDPAGFAASLRAGGSLTAHGAPSYDGAAMLNVPVVDGKAALRLVGYRSIDGGYIDDSKRGLTDINRGKIGGGRAALRVTPGDDWTIDAGWVRQDIQNRDGQYTDDGLPDLTQESLIAQPFDNDYSLYYLTVGKSWGPLVLRSTASIVRHDQFSRFDASILGTGSPLAYSQIIAVRQHASETTLSRQGASGHGWLVGVSVNDGNDRVTRTLGDPAAPATLSAALDERTDLSAFGEWSFGLTPDLSANIGGRYSWTRFAGELIDPVQPTSSEPRRTLEHFVPLVALSWKPAPRWLVYLRYTEGFRPGGLAVSGTNTAMRFESDTLSAVEIGARFGHADRDPLTLSLAASRTRWESIQADLIDAQGFPYTDNIGNGTIWGATATLGWRPVRAVQIDGAAFFNQSRLAQPAPGYERAEDNDLPNIARWGARIGVGWTQSLGTDNRLLVRGSARYFGPSFLGVGNMLDIKQGNYIDTAFDIRLEHRSIGVTLGLTNLFNADQNRFSYGNPFTVTQGLQETPLRPRTVRIGFDAAF